MESPTFVLAAIGLVVAVVFGSVNIYLSRKELEEQRHIAEGIGELAGDTLQAIKIAVTGALEVVQIDGAETRKAIRDVHKSIKEELGDAGRTLKEES